MIEAIRKWCMRNPRPKLIRATLQDDSTRDVSGPTGNQSWKALAETLAALDPVLLQAFDDGGTLLRARRIDDDEGDDQGDDEERERPRADFSIPSALNTDPETARLTHFANLLAQAYRFSTETAFDKMAELYSRIDARSASIEARLERTEANYRRVMQQQIDDAFEQAAGVAAGGAAAPDGKSAIVESFVSAWLQGQMAKAQAAPAAGKPTNGKGD